MTASTPITESSRTAGRRPGLPWWQAVPAGAVGATAVNLLLLGVADLAGAGLVLDASTAPHEITIGGVVTSSVGPLAAGTLLATLIAVWWPGMLRVAQVVAGVLGVATAAGPLSSEADGGTRATLVLMHLVAGTVAVLTLEAIRRRRRAAG